MSIKNKRDMIFTKTAHFRWYKKDGDNTYTLQQLCINQTTGEDYWEDVEYAN